MRSFSILRTNVGLTTNIKIMVDSNYNLYLESIDSTPELKIQNYKSVKFIKDNYYDDLIPFFYKSLPSEIAYKIKYDDDNDSMTDDFSNQYDEIYQSGARNILNNKSYSEEYEYFAPLYIKSGKMPSNFIIFRVDGLGLNSLDRFNIKNEVFKNFKTVKLFDLSEKNNIGYFLNKNFNINKFFPETPLEINFENLEFSKWNGIDYKSGGYVSKSLFMDEIFEKENEIFELEKLTLDNYKLLGVVYPNILNLSFLFDDNPANSQSLRKWSINRYYGFYLDSMNLTDSISPYSPPTLKSDVVIKSNNILYSPSGSPFVESWTNSKPFYVEYNGNYYKVEKFQIEKKPSVNPIKKNFTNNRNIKRSPIEYYRIRSFEDNKYEEDLIKNNTNTISGGLKQDELVVMYEDHWKIISDIDLSGKEIHLNKNTATIDSGNKIIKSDGSPFLIKNFELADVWLIDINGKYHNIIEDNGYLKLNTDYSFKFNDNSYQYWINKSDSRYTTTIDLKVDDQNKPKKFNIFKLNFTDIKDFDDRIVDTEYSKYEYEKSDTLTDTDESKMYMIDLNSDTFPKEIDEFILNNQNINIPVSSEYTANHETFKIENNDLSPIWRKNSVHCRWVYNNSLSANDYPYLMNNSDKFEKFNRTTNTYDPNPNRFERNLDYFYTINSSTYSYLHHTLHVENNDSNGLDYNFKFDFEKYLKKDYYLSGTYSKFYDFDYFEWFFNRKTTFSSNNIKKNVVKYSIFNKGDNNSPNSTLFRGIKFKVYDVENIRRNDDGNIDVVNIIPNNKYEDYKFSILLTESDNGMRWNIIDDWKMDFSYKSNSIVIFNDILYISNTFSNVTQPSFNRSTINGKMNIKNGPNFSDSWSIYNDDYSPFWNPNKENIRYYKNTTQTTMGSVVYNGGNWWYYDNIDNKTGVTFWNPNLSYNQNSIVIYKGELYSSNFNDNYYQPDYNQFLRITEDYDRRVIVDDIIQYNNVFEERWKSWWTKLKNTKIKQNWKKINIWNPSTKYFFGSYIIHNKIVYYSKNVDSFLNSIPLSEIPGLSIYWIKVYSLEPDTNYVYNSQSNPYILMNNEIYKVMDNPNKKTLENGINIFINKKWKNILVNIFVNDGTSIGLSNNDRDFLYTNINKKLTANNFISCLNNLTQKHDFTDYIKYTIIDVNNNISEYSLNNIESLPHIIFAETPQSINVKNNSLIYNSIKVNNLKSNKFLTNKKINSIKELNYFNNTHVATTIDDNKNDPMIIKSYHGLSNITHDTLFRFIGDYSPLFYKLQLFKSDNSIKYSEMQLQLHMDITDELNFTFQKNDEVLIFKETIDITKSINEQLINLILTKPIFNGIDFIFEVIKKDEQYSNGFNLNDDVLWVKWKSLDGDIKVKIEQTSPIIHFNIIDTQSSNQIIIQVQASSGHPYTTGIPYRYYIEETKTLPTNPKSSINNPNSSKNISKNNSTTGTPKYIISFVVGVKDRPPYEAYSFKGTYTVNNNPMIYNFDGVINYEPK